VLALLNEFVLVFLRPRALRILWNALDGDSTGTQLRFGPLLSVNIRESHTIPLRRGRPQVGRLGSRE
jgi:hypothetical protein